MKKKHDKGLVVFVCTGNICRSPMAEYLLKDRLGENSRWEICSAGVAAGYGMSASRSGIEILRQRGIDMTCHQSRYLDDELVYAADMIVVMTEEHKQSIMMVHPEVEDRVFLMKSFLPVKDSLDVEDPIGASIEVYDMISKEIDEAMSGLIDYLSGLEEKKWGAGG